MNNIQQSVILYYADYLSLIATSTPVTDNCKYYFVHDVPINSAYLLNLSPMFDPENKYYIQALDEINTIQSKYGDVGLSTFIDNIGYIKAQGTVNAKQLLKCIHHYSSRAERANAFKTYNNWQDNQVYTHIVINDDGEPVEEQCTRYVAHAELGNGSGNIKAFSQILGI